MSSQSSVPAPQTSDTSVQQLETSSPRLSALSPNDASGARGGSSDGGGQDRGDADSQGHVGRDQEEQGGTSTPAQGHQSASNVEAQRNEAQGSSVSSAPEHIGFQDQRAGRRQPQDLVPLGQGAAATPRKATVVVQTTQQPLTPTTGAPDSDDEGPQSEDGDGDFLADFPDDTPELELVHCRLASCESLHLPRFGPYLQQLCLRQNHIKSLNSADWHPLVELQELDLYDNQLKHIDGALSQCTKLESLDLSFNLFRSVPESLSVLVNLRSIYFVQNKISHIDNVSAFASLRTLELGGNRIRQIENLDALVSLEELWLGKNKIAKLENLDTLVNLRILSIQSNRITKLENLDALASLEELYISHNGIEKLEGLTHNLKLRTLDVGGNRIAALENISHLTELEELWANSNNIPDLGGLQRECANLAQLQTVYFEHNPAQRSDMVGYRRKIMLALPQVKQIDATFART